MFKIYEMNDDREKELWSNSIFVFDTCALHDFYFLKKSYREEIYKEIFEKNKDRFWIPGHVEFEFLKNRKKVIEKPIISKYIPLEKSIKSIIKNLNIKDKIKTIIESTTKDDRHPHIDQTDLNELSSDLDEFLTKIETHEKNIIDKINIAKSQVSETEENDDVLESINKYFKIGNNFNFEKIMEITKEGKHRFEFKIPPGYGDYYEKDKKGTQIFGDLIIWKQILEYSKENSKNIIFVTSDITKDSDWCEIDSKTKRILNPRHELIKEINDYSKVEFWMYNFEQFLFFSKKYTESIISQETLYEIKSTLKNKDAVNNKKKQIVDFLATSDFKKSFKEYIRSEYSNTYIYIEDDEILNKELISSSAYLYGFRIELESLEPLDEFDLFTVELISNNLISVSFISSLPATIDFCTDYSGYLELVENYVGKRNVQLNNMKGDGYCSLYETRIVNFQIVLDLHIDDKSTELYNTLEYLKDMVENHDFISTDLSYINAEII